METVYRRGRALATSLACALAVAGCGGSPHGTAPSPSSGASPAAAVPETRGVLVVFLGDSLTAGYGLSEEQAFPALVARELHDEGLSVRVVNAGVSGDTTAGGLERLGWVLKQRPDVLVVGLGGNDALRGQPLENIERNLRLIVAEARAAGARVLLLGQRIPPNYGPDYAEEFAAIYPRVAREAGATLMPFLLDGVGGRAALNQPDGIHPNARGHEVLAENVAPFVEKLVRAASPR